MLGTARCDEFRTDPGLKKACASLWARDIDAVVVIGNGPNVVPTR